MRSRVFCVSLGSSVVLSCVPSSNRKPRTDYTTVVLLDDISGTRVLLWLANLVLFATEVLSV